jgi:hypothetical protein
VQVPEVGSAGLGSWLNFDSISLRIQSNASRETPVGAVGAVFPFLSDLHDCMPGVQDGVPREGNISFFSYLHDLHFFSL